MHPFEASASVVEMVVSLFSYYYSLVLPLSVIAESYTYGKQEFCNTPSSLLLNKPFVYANILSCYQTFICIRLVNMPLNIYSSCKYEVDFPNAA